MLILTPYELSYNVEKINKEYGTFQEYPSHLVSENGIYKKIDKIHNELKKNGEEYGDVRFIYPFYKRTKLGNVTNTVEGEEIVGSYSYYSQLIFINDDRVEF